MTDRKRAHGLVVGSWIVAALTVLALLYAVLDHLAASTVGGESHMHMSNAFFRVGAGAPTQPLLGSALITAWQLDPVALAVLVLLAAGYLTAVALVPVRTPGERWPANDTALFLSGLVVIGLATNSSIAVYDQVLFTAHMVGHLALVMLAPAMLVAGRPFSLLVAASARPDRTRSMLQGRELSFLTAPPVALASYAVVIVGSHLTGLMDDIMRYTWAGQVEHLVYVVAGVQFFVLVIRAEPLRWSLTTPARWLMLAIAMAVDTFTGVVLLQSTTAVGMRTAPALNVNALSDTRTGGAIMWVGGDAIMAAVMVALVIGWLRHSDRRQRDQLGWAEQARRATFTEHTGLAVRPASEDDAGFDDDTAARSAYNEWLRSLSRDR